MVNWDWRFPGHRRSEAEQQESRGDCCGSPGSVPACIRLRIQPEKLTQLPLVQADVLCCKTMKRAVEYRCVCGGISVFGSTECH